MKEQDIVNLGFEIQYETAYNSGADSDWYYYTLNIGDIYLISNASDEAQEGWNVSIFDFPSFVIKDPFDLKALISIFKSNTTSKN